MAQTKKEMKAVWASIVDRFSKDSGLRRLEAIGNKAREVLQSAGYPSDPNQLYDPATGEKVEIGKAVTGKVPVVRFMNFIKSRNPEAKELLAASLLEGIAEIQKETNPTSDLFELVERRAEEFRDMMKSVEGGYSSGPKGKREPSDIFTNLANEYATRGAVFKRGDLVADLLENPREILGYKVSLEYQISPRTKKKTLYIVADKEKRNLDTFINNYLRLAKNNLKIQKRKQPPLEGTEYLRFLAGQDSNK